MSMQLTVFEHIKTEKYCGQCKQLRPFVDFCKNKRRRDNLNWCCKQCNNVNRKKNQESISQHKKVYYENNKDAYALRSKVYREKNKEVIANRVRNRRKSDPLLRLITNLRSRAGHFCKSVSMQKNWSTIDAMGCNREEFIAYFEPLFTEGMTWENYGAWQVDHIKPISLAKTEQEAIQLSHYTNLQPLWATDNKRKGNNY